MKIWITKYALSQGIFTLDLRIEGTMACGTGWGEVFHGENRQWCRTAAAAVCRANDMRNAKLESLGRQAAKLKTLDFAMQAKKNIGGTL